MPARGGLFKFSRNALSRAEKAKPFLGCDHEPKGRPSVSKKAALLILADRDFTCHAGLCASNASAASSAQFKDLGDLDFRVGDGATILQARPAHRLDNRVVSQQD